MLEPSTAAVLNTARWRFGRIIRRRGLSTSCRLCTGKTHHRDANAQILRGKLRHSWRLRKADWTEQRTHINLIDDQQLGRVFNPLDEIGDLLNLPADLHLNANF